MIKKVTPILFLSLAALISCGGESPSDSHETKDVAQDSVYELDDTIYEDEIDYPVTDYTGGVTISAMVDGPDDDFYIENFGDYDEESILNFNVLDIVPYVYESEDSSSIDASMQVVARDNFSFYYGTLSNYSGTINLFYDATKNHLASSFTIKNGKAEGNCTFYDTDGNVYIERVFKGGKWQYSGKEPYSADWIFDQDMSSLIINDKENGIRNDELIEIMPSFNNPEWNWLDLMVEKQTFVNAFVINGSPYTGKLMAYQHPSYFDATPIFELNFKDGFLHGEIKLYTWWGQLELHETFEDGMFIEEIYKMDESMMDGVAKPIIYIYPEEETEVDVNLDFEGRLTHTYPKYQHGWKVTASPDGTLKDAEGKEYYALYWEGKETAPLTIPNGTILKGSETIAFLEEELPKMGLNAREANEFIIFWMPYLENNPYNLIHFASDAYTDMAALNITPQPETMIRVMMVFRPLESEISFQKQNLSELYQERKGFTVVEWGGRQLFNLKM